MSEHPYDDDFKGLQQHALDGCAACQNQLGAYYDQQKDLPNAIIWFRKAAEQNLLISKHNLACKLYEIGQTVEGRKWFEIAASAGYPSSLYYLGVIYEMEDDCNAITCFRKAAELGNKNAIQVLEQLGIS